MSLSRSRGSFNFNLRNSARLGTTTDQPRLSRMRVSTAKAQAEEKIEFIQNNYINLTILIIYFIVFICPYIIIKQNKSIFIIYNVLSVHLYIIFSI